MLPFPRHGHAAAILRCVQSAGRTHRVRFLLGTLATSGVFGGGVLLWWSMPDIDPHGEGLAFVLFSVLLCLAVVFVWTGVEGFLGLRLRAIMIRWSVVTVVTALVLELAAIATGVVTAGLADLPVGLAFESCWLRLSSRPGSRRGWPHRRGSRGISAARPGREKYRRVTHPTRAEVSLHSSGDRKAARNRSTPAPGLRAQSRRQRTLTDWLCAGLEAESSTQIPPLTAVLTATRQSTTRSKAAQPGRLPLSADDAGRFRKQRPDLRIRRLGGRCECFEKLTFRGRNPGHRACHAPHPDRSIAHADQLNCLDLVTVQPPRPEIVDDLHGSDRIWIHALSPEIAPDRYASVCHYDSEPHSTHQQNQKSEADQQPNDGGMPTRRYRINGAEEAGDEERSEHAHSPSARVRCSDHDALG